MGGSGPSGELLDGILSSVSGFKSGGFAACQHQQPDRGSLATNHDPLPHTFIGTEILANMKDRRLKF